MVINMKKLLLQITLCLMITTNNASALDPITVDIVAPELCGGLIATEAPPVSTKLT